MLVPEHTGSARSRSGIRWRRWLLALVLSCALIGAGGGWYLTRPAHWVAMGERLLEQYTAGEARVATAHLSWDGHVTLEDVSLRVPDLPGEAGQLFEAETVQLTLDPAALLRGALRVDAVRLGRPTLHLIELADTGTYNHQHLPGRLPEEDPDWLADLRLPAIAFSEGTVRLGQWKERTLHVRDELRLVGQFLPITPEPRTYHFSLQQQSPNGEPAPRLHGTLDPGAQRIVADLDHFRFTQQQRGFLPPRFRRWWDRLDPDGALPSVRVRYDPDTGYSARMRMEDVAVNLPIRDVAARLADVTGRFVFENHTLRIDDLTGRIGDVRYHVDGTVEGFGADAPLNLALRTEPFTVSEDSDDAPLAPLLPEAVRRTYAEFDPAGRFQARLRMRRERHGEPMRYTGAIELLGATTRYQHFPYPLHDLRGHVRFDNQRVVIDGLEGRGPDGGSIHVNGTVTPPGTDAALDIDVHARDIPLDATLMQALDPQHRRIVEMFVSADAHQQLLDANVITTPEDPAPTDRAEQPMANDGPPPFALGGAFEARARIERPAGPDAGTEVTLTLDGEGVNLIFAHWPYPLQFIDGSITIASDRVSVDDVHLRGPTGAEGTLQGRMTREPGEDLVPDVALKRVRLPVDELLLASIPEPQNHWLRRMNLETVAQGEGRVFHDETGETHFELDFTLENARLRPFDSDFALDRVAGRVQLRRDALVLTDLTGRRDEGMLRAVGEVQWGGDEPVFALRIDGEAVPIETSLLDLLPASHVSRAQLAGLFEAYNPAGRFDATLRYENASAEAEADGGAVQSLALSPRSLAFDFRGRRIELHEMTGDVTLHPGRAQLEALHGSFDHGEAALTGDIDLNEPIVADLQLTARADRLGSSARALLPPAVVEAIDQLELEGAFELADGRLRWQSPGNGESSQSRAGHARDAEADAPRLAFDGEIELAQASLQLGLPISNLAGRLAFQYAEHGDRARPDISLDLRAHQLEVMGRHVTPARLHVVTTHDRNGEEPASERAWPWTIRTLRAELYDGIVTGEGGFDLVDDGGYEIDMTMQRVRLAPMLEPSLWPVSPAQAEPEPGAEAEDTSNATTSRQPLTRRPDTADASASDDGRTASADATVPDFDPARLPPGHIDASLTLEGRPGDGTHRRGRGRIRVEEAELFERPLDMAVLQAVNLALPLAGGFERADIDYIIDGESIRLERIHLDSPTLAIVGAGTMDATTRSLDLTLFARNPAGDALGPLSEMINAIRDELICIKVAGTLEAPEARVVSLDNMRSAWQRMFD